MKPETLEHYLVQLHGGQWFGWSDSKNKIYANLIIHDNSKTKPTEKECTEGLEQLKLDYALSELRIKRNDLLTETDYIVIKAKETGGTIPSAWKTYRQELRDLTNGLTTVDEVNAVEFPERPST
tara:strand:- start:117 stop:488 length:372 start_codon:yes stop_codon:yes gene_type:complete